MNDIGKDLQDAFMDGYNYRDAEIVRCKECKRSTEYSDKQFTCRWFDTLVFPDDFCSNGERRSE